MIKGRGNTALLDTMFIVLERNFICVSMAGVITGIKNVLLHLEE